MKITKEALEKIIKSYPAVPPENGGIIGSKNGIICEYFHDVNSHNYDFAIYEPDIELLNSTILLWKEQGIDFQGIVHSHLPEENSLFGADKEYIEQIFETLPREINCLYFPIVLPNTKQIFSYKAMFNNETLSIEHDEIEVV